MTANDGPAAWQPPVEPWTDPEFYRWYGPWAPTTPVDIAAILDGLAAPWWIVGGWAIDAATGTTREHEDIDVGFFRDDLPTVLAHVGSELCIWSNLSGTLRPLRTTDDLLDGARQLWVRRDGASPWLFDLAMTAHLGDTWISPRDERIRRPLDRAIFSRDGIRYLRPELVLFMKARVARQKDERDLEVVLPTLPTEELAWLRGAVGLVHHGHPWLDRLAPRPRGTG